MLWPVLDHIFQLGLRYDNSEEAVRQRQEFLVQQRFGISDIVESCKRTKIDASDLGMTEIRLRNIIEQLQLHPTIRELIFTGGNSKNGPEYLFRKQLKQHGLQLDCLDNSVPRIHHFLFDSRMITTTSLTSPSNAANRAIGSNELYKRRKKNDPTYTTFEFRIEQYRRVFKSA